MATEGMQTGSPSKPADDAVFPEENAYVTAECGTKEKRESVMKEKEATMQGQIILDNQEKEKEGQITAAMLQEENKMHEETEKEEDRLQKEQEKFWSSLDEEDREKQYVRLKFLLTKSNMYTKYLLQRMEAQREEQEKKMARKRKREEKKKNTENASSTKILSPTTRNTKTALRESGNTSNIPVSEADERLSSTPRNKESKSRKKGKKRKAGEITSDEDTQVKRSKVTENHKEASEGVNLNEVKETEKAVSCSDLPEGESADDRKSTEEEEDVEEEEEDRSHMPKGAPRDQPVLFSGGVLRAYQMEGFHWLRTLYENGVNGILADEMGLGKTIQCIALISHMVNMGVTGPFLVCTPLSTLPNWYSEFTRFAPKVPVVLYHGTKEDRNVKRRRLRSRVMIKPGVSVYPVFITSYEVTMRDRKQLQNYDWKYLIVDEGHRIKNTQCRLIKELKMYRNTHRLLLTGTPLQNNLSELWSLLNFLLPEIFDDMGSFETWFNVESIVSSGAEEKIVKEEQEKNILSMLHQILTPFMLRRLKQDVDLLIPPKKEILVYAPLSERQQEVYTSLVDRTIFNKIEEEKAEAEPEIEYNDQGRPVRRATAKKVDYSIMFPQKQDDRDNSDLEEELESWAQAIAENISTVQQSAPVYKEASERSNLNLRNILMELRKCCNHPYLLETPTLEQMFSISEEIVSSCGKMRLLDCMLKELKDRGHRVLIFSQMTRMLDILEDYCSLRQYSYCRLDGRCRLADRQESIGQFNKDAENFIFLLSTRAGGLGLNLMAADTVIIYDSDWNPQCDLQAQDRCHRIGQTKPVVVYRLVTANTVDQKIVERAAAKRRLEKMVIHKGKFKQGIKNFQETIKPLNSLDLLELLHSKDHEKEIKGLNGKVISKKEMNSLMDRSDMWAMMSKTPGKTASKDSTKKRSAGAKEVDGVFKVIDEECCGKVPTSVDS